MPLPALGLEERVGISLENRDAYAPATPKAVLETFLTESFGLEKIQPKEAVPGRFGPVRGFHGIATANARRVALPGKVQGPWTFPFSYNRPIMLLAWNLLAKDAGGAAPGNPTGYSILADTGYNGTATGSTQHIFKMQNHTADPSRALQLTRFNGQQIHVFQGCYLRSFELTVPENGVAMVTADVLGKRKVTFSPAITTIDTAAPYTRITDVIVSRSATVNDTRANMALDANVFGGIFSLNFRIEHVLRELAGSNNSHTVAVDNSIMQPINIDYSRVSGSFRCDWNQNTWQDFWDGPNITDTYVCLEIRLKSQVLIPGTAAPFDFVIRIPACHLSGTYPKDPGGPGPIPEEITFEADIFDAGAGAFETVNFEFYNNVATMIGTP